MSKLQKMHVKIGDTIKVISGSEKNKTGEIIKVYKNTGKIIVKGINFPSALKSTRQYVNLFG